MRRGFKFWYLAAAAGVLLLLGLAFQAGSLRQTVAVEQAAQTAPEQAPAPEQQEERQLGRRSGKKTQDKSKRQGRQILCSYTQ